MKTDAKDRLQELMYLNDFSLRWDGSFELLDIGKPRVLVHVMDHTAFITLKGDDGVLVQDLMSHAAAIGYLSINLQYWRTE